MGTLFRVTVYAESRAAAQSAMTAAFARAHELDAILSDYKPDSELNLLTRRPRGSAEPVGADLLRVLEVAQKIARASNGAFDVTLGPVIQLWRQAKRTGLLPSPSERTRALRRSGWRHLHVDTRQSTLRLDRQGMQLDLGGIAKGYAADEMLTALRNRGIGRALVAAGGDLRIGEAPPGENGWRVKLDWTNEQLILADCAVSTSGDTEQWVEIGGERYSHIVDPKTGLGLKRSSPVTVIAPTGLIADPLATALSVMSRGRGNKLAANFGAAVRRP
ncbi:MAG: FAD:protein FMN transferase [Bryobacterales bacterium]|nr:FAD:protein FMN transferase [Bryobacterales bacterium]